MQIADQAARARRAESHPRVGSVLSAGTSFSRRTYLSHEQLEGLLRPLLARVQLLLHGHDANRPSCRRRRRAAMGERFHPKLARLDP